MKQFFDLSVSKVARKTTRKVHDFPIARKSIQLSIWIWCVTVGNRIPARQTKIERNVFKMAKRPALAGKEKTRN